MKKEPKSTRYDVQLRKSYESDSISSAVEAAAEELGIYISHVGGYSRKKYPNSIHWHFKESPKKIGCLDATFWEEGNEFWIVVRNYEPTWVARRAKQLQSLLSARL